MDGRATPPGPSLVDRAARLVRAAAPDSDVVELDGVERLRRTLSRAGRRSPRRLAVGLGAAASIAVALIVFVRPGWGWWRPVRFTVDGAELRTDGAIVRSGPGRAVLRFSEGTRFELGPGSEAKVVERSRNGARLILSRGRLSAAVVARSGARWVVQAGPYEVLVTGTRFDVSFPEPTGSFQLDMTEGSVLVRGGLAQAGIHLHGGQRLRSTEGHRLVITESGAAARPAPTPSAEATAVVSGPPSPIDPTGRAPRAKPPKGRAVAAAASRTAPLGPRAIPAPTPDAADTDDDPPSPTPAVAPCQKPALYQFEDSTEHFKPDTFGTLAFSNARVDRTLAFCGHGSLRVDADFNLRGHPMAWGRMPHQNGEVRVRLGSGTTDLTGRTLTARFYVDAPAGVRFAVMMFAISRAIWVGVGYTESCHPRQWCTVSHTFAPTEPLWPSGTATVKDVTHLSFQVLAVGPQLEWKGTVNIDDIHLE